MADVIVTQEQQKVAEEPTVNFESSEESSEEEEDESSEEEQSDEEEQDHNHHSKLNSNPDPDVQPSASSSTSLPADVANVAEPERFNPSPLAHGILPSSAALEAVYPTPAAAQPEPATSQPPSHEADNAVHVVGHTNQTVAAATAENKAVSEDSEKDGEEEESSEEESSEEEDSSEEESEEEEEEVEAVEAEVIEKAQVVAEVPQVPEKATYVSDPERFNPAPYVTFRIIQVKEVDTDNTTGAATGVMATSDPERFNPSPFVATRILNDDKSAAIDRTKPRAAEETSAAPISKSEAEFESESESEESEEDSDDESSEEESESEEEERTPVPQVVSEATQPVQSEMNLGTTTTTLVYVSQPERFNPAPYVSDRILPPGLEQLRFEISADAAQSTTAAVTAIATEATPSHVGGAAEVKKIIQLEESDEDSDEESDEESAEEYESESEEDSEEDIEIISPVVSSVPATSQRASHDLQPERFNPSPFIESRIIRSSSSLNAAQDHQMTAIQPERFNPSPFIESYIITLSADILTEKTIGAQPERFNPSPNLHILTKSKSLYAVLSEFSVNEVQVSQPERFNPSPHVDSKILTAQGTPTTAAASFPAASPVQPERFNPSPQIDSRIIREIVPVVVVESTPAAPVVTLVAAPTSAPKMTERPVLSVVEPERFNPSPLILSRLLSPAEAAAFGIINGQPSAYEKLKNLLEAGRQLDAEDVPLFAEEKLAASEAPLIAAATSETEKSYSGPRTAAEYLEDAARKAEEQALSLYSPHMMVMRHLVTQQQRLHDMLTDMRHQFSNAEWQVSSIRNERFNVQTTLKKKHPWRRLIR